MNQETRYTLSTLIPRTLARLGFSIEALMAIPNLVLKSKPMAAVVIARATGAMTRIGLTPKMEVAPFGSTSFRGFRL